MISLIAILWSLVSPSERLAMLVLGGLLVAGGAILRKRQGSTHKQAAARANGDQKSIPISVDLQLNRMKTSHAPTAVFMYQAVHSVSQHQKEKPTEVI